MDCQASDEVGSENFHLLRNHKRISCRKEMEIIPVEFLQSSQKKFSVVDSGSAGSSRKNRVFDGTKSFKYFKNINTMGEKLPLMNSGDSIMPGNSAEHAFCCNSDKDKQVLQASEVEQLSARLKILEEEIGTIRQEFFEQVRDRKSLLNYIRHQFRMIHCRLHQQQLDCQPEKERKTGYCLIRSSMHRLNSTKL